MVLSLLTLVFCVSAAKAQWEPPPEPEPEPQPEPAPQPQDPPGAPGYSPVPPAPQPEPQPQPGYQPAPSYPPQPQPAPQPQAPAPYPQPYAQQPYAQQGMYAPAPPPEPRLLTGKGSMQLGGTLMLNYNHVAEKDSDWQNGTLLSIAPSLGYFVLDNLELLAAFEFARGIGQLYEDQTAFGLGLGIKNHFDLGKVFLYLGVAMGMDFIYPDGGDFNDMMKFLSFEIPFGVLIPLNQHVAIDVGMRVDASIYLHEHWVMSVSVPLGYLGVQAYF